MELKLIEIQKAQSALQKVMNADLPVKIAFRLSRVAKVIDGVFIDIEAQRAKLIKKYGVPSKDGFTVKPENVAQFQEEFTGLLSEESVELNIEPFGLELLEGIKLTALDMMALESFIKE